MEKWITRQTVDLAQAGNRPTLYAPEMVQGSVNGMDWQVTVQKDGKAVDLSGRAILAVIVRPDGVTVPMDGKCSGSVATVTMGEEVCDVAGTARGIMWATRSSDDVVPIAWMRWDIIKGSTGAVISTSSTIPNLTAIMAEIADMRRATSEANTAIEQEKKRVSAETARANAESSRAAAEGKRVSAETARASAENSRASAETARASAENSRASAETARANAESSRATAEGSRASAETARAAAETARATNEGKRVAAETYRRTSLGGLSFAINAEDGGLDITYNPDHAKEA